MLKGLAWLVSAILAAVIASVAVLMLSDRAFFAVITRLVTVYTPYCITLDEPRINWFEGKLEINTLQVHHAGNEGAPMLGVDELSVSGAPTELLQLGISRADVTAGAVLVYVDATDTSEDPNPAEWLQYTAMFPRKLSVGTLHVVSKDQSVNIFPFSNLYGGWQDSSHFVASAGADYTGTPLIIALSAERRALSANSSSLAIHGAMKPQQGSSRIELDGELTATDEAITYRFDLHAEYERVQDFLNAIEDGAYPFEGTLMLDGTLAGDLDQYDLDVRQLALDNGEIYYFTASGSVRKTLESPAQLDVRARGRMASVDQLLDLVDIDIGNIGAATAELSLVGPLTDPVLDEFAIQTRNQRGLELSVTPHAGTFTLQQQALLPGQALVVSMSAPGLTAVEPWLGAQPLDPGAWSLTLRVSQTDTAFQLSELALNLGDSALFKGSVSGSVESLRFTDAATPDISGIDLLFSGSTEDVPGLLRAFAPQMQALPALNTAQVSGVLRGSSRELTLEKASINATGVDMIINARNLAATLRPLDTLQIVGADAQIALSLPSLASLDGMELPEQIKFVDSLTFDAKASYSGAVLSLDNVISSANALTGSVHARGRIDDALNGKDLALDIALQDIPLTELAAALQPQDTSAAMASLPGRLSGIAHLNGDVSALAIEKIDLSLQADEAAGATLQGTASVTDGIPRAQVEMAYRLDDRELIATLLGHPLAPGSGTVVLDYQPQRVVVVVHSLMGDSDISVVLNATRDKEDITRLDVDLNVPRLYLPDLIGIPQAEGLRDVESGEGGSEQTAESLTWRDSLPTYPLRVQANIGEIVGDNTAMDGFTFTLSGADRRYILEQFDIAYAGGSVVFRGVADLASEAMGISLAGSAEAMPITAVAADLGYGGDIEGTLSLLAGLTVQGDSVDAMLRSLSGRLSAAVADGHIEGAAYDLLATDLLGWLFSGGLLSAATDFQCAAVNFNLRDGRATSDRLYILTRNMIASGDAAIDLAGRQLDIRVQPRARKRSVQMPSSITVRGPLDNPRVSISPIAATMDTTAKILFFVPDLLLRLFGLGPDAEGKVQACTVDG
ncbi:MAG: AsmA-like C-terminal region-containing protein [Chromatocurvus sp.]